MSAWRPCASGPTRSSTPAGRSASPAVHAGGAARAARHGGGGLARARAGAGPDGASASRQQGIQLGYHNHHWELKPKDGEQDRARADLRGGRGQPAHLAGRRGLAGARRRRPEGLDRALPQPGHLGARQGHRAGGQNEDQDGWADVGAGVLDWRDLWRACRDGRRPVDGGRARQADRPGAHRPRAASPSCRRTSRISKSP